MHYIGKMIAIALVVFAIGALNSAIKWSCLWWDVAQQVGHGVAKVILLAPAMALIICGILMVGARNAWQLSEGRVEQ